MDAYTYLSTLSPPVLKPSFKHSNSIGPDASIPLSPTKRTFPKSPPSPTKRTFEHQRRI